MHNVLTIFQQLEVLLVLLLFGVGGSKEESTACDAGADCQAWTPALPLSSWGDMVSNHHPDCADTNERDCPMKALLNACVKSPETMLTECPFSCGLCNNLEKGHVKTCYGVLQNVEDNNESILNVIRKSQHYMTRQVFVDDMYANIRSNCKNRHVNCSKWAVEGECAKNPNFMKKECAPACQTCDYLDIHIRCPFNESQLFTTSWSEPGNVDRFFSSLVQNETIRKLYNVTVLSGPTETTLYNNKLDENGTEADPWVVQLDHFLSPMECQRLIDLGHETGFKRSKDIGRMKKYDGSTDSYESQSRTSSTAWCTETSVCGQDPIQHRVVQRIHDLIQIPSNNSEALQLLRYQENQFYKLHHDFTPLHSGTMAGVRILTVFLYLNDDQVDGGGTNFPALQNLTVFPKQGRALLWPSVLNDQPGKIDIRTEHQALPVERGVKFAANVWVHERDFRTPLHLGCGV